VARAAASLEQTRRTADKRYVAASLDKLRLRLEWAINRLIQVDPNNKSEHGQAMKDFQAAHDEYATALAQADPVQATGSEASSTLDSQEPWPSPQDER